MYLLGAVYPNRSKKFIYWHCNCTKKNIGRYEQNIAMLFHLYKPGKIVELLPQISWHCNCPKMKQRQMCTEYFTSFSYLQAQ
jgi:hypothetical protein